ncbi:phosphate-starvation-inducible PsiE family protein [Weissella minor]|uniref:phosphate-starvation-inducible PsiE family protein n=1 Tax=Weissella minor TaxID=1620 RepID=UPI001BAE9948|nr:phosphate-starvation-inducible PsiE family protein [Weissella minor]MBS0949303.1 phosphate-starvation-inducible PsiE family protein [Weissella minor]
MLKKKAKLISNFSDWVIMAFMLVLGLVIAGYFCLEIVALVEELFQHSSGLEFTDVSESILSLFLCIEFLVIIKDYFSNNAEINFEDYLYVAVTAIIRAILVYHDDALKILTLSGAILILIIAIILYKRYQNSQLSEPEEDN